ncbi:hypothetical protein [Mycobacteroides abscessus]|uniref:Uncharacterized protein n=2 Tax=Mycobacteroides abscessus TaxID=36809 RepID=A0A829MCY3_9MYCO|nr:hypothetical protein [Mycobacteroides abscessus]ESV58902.1 hypothetical protein L830_4754 [Mycobacteroides abscessus MAB_082312_2258]ESV62286.1 hypothetical protein L833_4691 [Mycobacteroides abscessus MAB_091912_2446]QSM04447.1 hypothetical protein PROPHIGD02-2_45 [Mycobacterium phage prophiGD02-2]QST87315.1 hypothetical protein PROPHIGD90-1_45 [Mycobacterium phage prophiGD90-1]EIV14630.1 hypothetical protein MM2B0912R_1394 [Mycobacteroides abscessus subsp. bolletii 2B-0912-R]
MTDPAVEAARRAWRVQTGSEPLADDNYTIWVRTIAAREALKPIRESHQHLTKMASGESIPVWTGMMAVLNVLAPLIYKTEELER